MKKVILMLATLQLMACAQGGGSDTTTLTETAPSEKAPISDLIVPTINASAPVVARPALTYYKLTKSIAPVNGWIYKTVSLTASCVVYQTITYCWDDGIKTLGWKYNGYTYGPFTYTYFGLAQRSNGGFSMCFGACSSDFMPAPRNITQSVKSNIGLAATNNTGVSTTGDAVINEVFSSGQPINVSCVEQDNQLNCNDFVINLNQVPQ